MLPDEEQSKTAFSTFGIVGDGICVVINPEAMSVEFASEVITL